MSLRKRPLFRSTLLLGFIALATNSAVAADFVRTELNRMQVDAGKMMEVVVSDLVIQPNGAVLPHTHPGNETAYVIRGTRVKIFGQGERNLVAGDVLIFPRGLIHGIAVTGSAPLEMVTVHVVEKGKPMLNMVNPEAATGKAR